MRGRDYLIKEAAAYFKQKGFQRLLQQMTEKYRSLGRWAGSVKLEDLTTEEQEALSSFFRQDYRRQGSAVISLAAFARSLEQTRFAGLTCLELLAYVNGEPLLTKQQVYTEQEKRRDEYFTRLARLYPGSSCQNWLAAIVQRAETTRSVQLAYDKNPVQLERQLKWVLEALTELEDARTKMKERFERLPVFAQRITGNPHEFDLNAETGKLLINALTHWRSWDHQLTASQVAIRGSQGFSSTEAMSSTEGLTATEAVNELLYHYGLMRDDLWNFVTCTGLLARDREGKDLPVWRAACQSGGTAVLNVPLREMVKVLEVYPADTQSEKIVYVVENPAVFSALLDASDQEGRAYPPLVCTHGQFKLAALLLMDKLATAGTKIYYSGDFDPEGLLMAESLFKRYPGSLTPWHYTVDAYLFSQPATKISAQRLKKLEKVQSPQLLPIKNKILASGLAGYQEGIIPLLWGDINS
ncbi:MAG: TIGR02679 family protein [Desulfitobacteriia bacterium]